MRRALTACVVFALAIFTLTACGNSDKATDAGPTADKQAVTAVDFGEGDQAAGLKVGLKGPLQVNFRKITIPPGQSTGKHCHYGNLIAVVEQGTLTHYAPIYPSGVHKYQAGDSIFEGSGYVHEGKNQGNEDVVLLVNYVTPEGKPLAETDLARCDTN